MAHSSSSNCRREAQVRIGTDTILTGAMVATIEYAGRAPLAPMHTLSKKEMKSMKSAIMLLAFTPAFLFGDAQTNAVDRIHESQRVMSEVMNTPDHAIPREILEKAQCIGIIPGVKKAAFLVGAKYGKGVLTCRSASGWSAPETVILEGGSIGFQIGGGETDVVFVVQNRSGENKLMQDKFTFNASAGAMAGPVGRTASAETDAQLHAEILSWSRSRGLFAGIDLGGATLRPDHADNRALYGANVTPHEILDGGVASPAAAKSLDAELNRWAPRRGSMNATR